MSDLIEFLRARLDEDEANARAAGSAPWEAFERDADWHIGEIDGSHVALVGRVSWPRTTAEAEHIARHDPARVLREVEAKRRILAMHGPTVDPDGELSYPAAAKLCRTCGPGDTWEAEREPFGHLPCDHQRLLALPYSDHPDYDEAWRP